MRIFVSYTTRDEVLTKGLLSKLYEKLSLNNHVYIDLLHNNSENKQKRVFDELAKSEIVLLITTDSINQSNWVNLELEYAEKMDIRIVQISIEKANKIIYNSLNIKEIVVNKEYTVANKV